MTLYDTMVHYMAQHQAAGHQTAPQASALSNDLTAEIAAMAKIAAALGDLDASTRARVLRWVADRFSAAALTQPPVTAPPARPDMTLSVDGLGELFADRKSSAPAEPAVDGPSEPVESMVRGFVDEFQRIAREWQGA